jgi:hypothetical protein
VDSHDIDFFELPKCENPPIERNEKTQAASAVEQNAA